MDSEIKLTVVIARDDRGIWANVVAPDAADARADRHRAVKLPDAVAFRDWLVGLGDVRAIRVVGFGPHPVMKQIRRECAIAGRPLPFGIWIGHRCVDLTDLVAPPRWMAEVGTAVGPEGLTSLLAPAPGFLAEVRRLPITPEARAAAATYAADTGPDKLAAADALLLANDVARAYDIT